MRQRAGWYPDPWLADDLRWWDGQSWTDWVHDDSTLGDTPRIPDAPTIPTAPTMPAASAEPGAGPRSSSAHSDTLSGLVEVPALKPLASSRPLVKPVAVPQVDHVVVGPDGFELDLELLDVAPIAPVVPTASVGQPRVAPEAFMPATPPPMAPPRGPRLSGPPTGLRLPGPPPAPPTGPALFNLNRQGNSNTNIGRWLVLAAFMIFGVGSCVSSLASFSNDSPTEITWSPDYSYPPGLASWDIEVARACEIVTANPSLASNSVVSWDPEWADESSWRVELVNDVDRCVGSTVPPTLDGAECGPVDANTLQVGPARYAGRCVSMNVLVVSTYSSENYCTFSGYWSNDPSPTRDASADYSSFDIDDCAGVPVPAEGETVTVRAEVVGGLSLDGDVVSPTFVAIGVDR